MSSKTCDHCQEIIIHEYQLNLGESFKSFCCNGCLNVFQILNTNGLDEYYQLRDKVNGTPNFQNEEYLYLDHSEFQNKYILNKEFSFYIEGIHCLACLWILEKLPQLCSDVVSSQLNMSKGVLKLTLKDEVKLSRIAQTISQLGYRPHPILENEDEKKFEKKEERKALIQIAVAFASAGNIMLYALAVYTGAKGEFKDYFNLFSFICILPVIFYSAIPFYKSSLAAIKNKLLSIDIPIVLAIFISLGMGIYSLLFNKDYFYFDTISILVFLLLSARFVLKKVQRNYLSKYDFKEIFNSKYATKIVNGQYEQVLSSMLKIDDEIIIKKNEIIPIDGIIIKGTGHINNSLLTGETFPVKSKINDPVFMGAKNLSSELIVRVTNSVDKTQLGQIFDKIESAWKKESQINIITEKISRRFVSFIFILSSIFFVYFSLNANVEIAIERTLSLLLITCPCALALTTPLAITLGLTVYAKNGIIIKNEAVVEKLSIIKNIFWDKTGTLTSGQFEIKFCNEVTKKIVDIIYTLEQASQHPIAKAIVKYIEKKYSPAELNFSEITEIPGVGVQGVIDDKEYILKSLDSKEVKKIGLFEDNNLIFEIELKDELLDSAQTAIRDLSKQKINSSILSGDQKTYVEQIGEKLGFKKESCLSELKPQAKLEIIKNSETSVMVGDGVNDALALKEAFVGIATRGSMDIALRAADIYLSGADISKIPGLIKSTQYLMYVIKRNILFSFTYNLIGIYLAATGQVSPLVAAILMPLSSLTVLSFTILSAKKVGKILG